MFVHRYGRDAVCHNLLIKRDEVVVRREAHKFLQGWRHRNWTNFPLMFFIGKKYIWSPVFGSFQVVESNDSSRSTPSTKKECAGTVRGPKLSPSSLSWGRL